MKKKYAFLLSLLTFINFAQGQNILELSNQKNFVEYISYERFDKFASVSISVNHIDLKYAKKNYSHGLLLVISDISKYPLNTKIFLKSDSLKFISCSYNFDLFNSIDKRFLSGRFDGFIEIVELSDSTLKLNIDIIPLDAKGKASKFYYKGVRSCKIKRNTEPTQEEKSSKLISLGIDSLINVFNSNWQLKETGKAYWIGYTDEMYAIATMKDSAISKLVDYINSTNNIESKIGAIYCLHLIGIDSKIAGRFVEKFVNKNARNALLKLVFQKDLSPLIVSLLARDPWPSDMPVLYQLLKESHEETLINALFRYSKNEMPFRDNISENIDTINVVLKDTLGTHPIGRIITVYKEKENEQLVKSNISEKGYISGDVITFKEPNNYTSQVNILNHGGDVIIQYGDKGRIVRRFIPNTKEIRTIENYFNCNVSDIKKSMCNEINQLFYHFFMQSKEKVDVFSYCHFGDNLFYYLNSSNQITICDLETARQRWLQFLKEKGY